ncbi:MAG TPA: hypothetical protein DD723_08540 [Candidatus Omnitrophica bacterium]|nr:hypothetical protein [Candidatus Omnitrophota bacterium]
MSVPLFGLILFILDIIAAVDCAKSNMETRKKILWMILIFVFPFLGLLLYYLLAKKQS